MKKLSVTINLDHIHCYKQPESGGSEPYLWTVFFFLDMDTIDLGWGNRVITYTPHSNWTTRGLYPGGGEAGDDINIPEDMGTYTFSLDDGDIGKGLVGVLYALLEEDGTDGDAIKAGHQAFAEKVNEELNWFIDYYFPGEPPDPLPKEQIQQMADNIEGEVIDTIKDNLDVWDYFDGRDDFLGFGYEYYIFDDLMTLASQSDPESVISGEPINKTVTIKNPFGQTFTLEHEYQIIGSVRAKTLRPLAPHNDLYKYYEAAVNNYKDIISDIQEITSRLKVATGDKKNPLLTQLEFLKKSEKPDAVKAMRETRAAYDEVRHRHTEDISRYREIQKELRKSREERISRKKPNPFRRSANVSHPKTLSLTQKKIGRED